MANTEREALWKERFAQWRVSGQSQRAFAMGHGYAQRQLNYWARRLAVANSAPAFFAAVDSASRGCRASDQFA